MLIVIVGVLYVCAFVCMHMAHGPVVVSSSSTRCRFICTRKKNMHIIPPVYPAVKEDLALAGMDKTTGCASIH